MSYERLGRVLDVKGWPRKKELAKDQIFRERSLVDDVIRTLEKQRVCLIRGSEGRGKTSLARLVGYRYLVEKKWEVWHVDLSEEEDLESVLYNIRREGQNRNVLQIIENVHARVDVFREIDEEIGKLKSSILFTSRLIPRISGYDYESKTTEIIEFPSDREASRETIKKFAEWYITTHADKFKDSPFVPPLVNTTDWEHDVEWALAEFSVNLRALTICLETWAPQAKNRRLHQTDRQTLLRSIVVQRFDELSLEEIATLVKVSALYQFEVPVWNQKFDLQVLDSLRQKGLIQIEGDYCTLEHTTDARQNVQGHLLLSGREDAGNMNFIYLKKYLTGDVPPNFAAVINALHRQNEQTLLKTLVRNVDVNLAAESFIITPRKFSQRVGFLKTVSSHSTMFNRLVSSIVSNLDPHELATEAVKGRISSVQWFLIYLAKSRPNGWQDFGHEFLSNINGVDPQFLFREIKEAALSTIASVTKAIRKFHRDLSNQLRREIRSSGLQRAARMRSDLKRAAHSMGGLILSKTENQVTEEQWQKARKTSESVIASPNLALQIKETTVRNLGKLLSGFVKLEANQRLECIVVEEMAKQTAENVKLDSLAGKYAYDLEELSLVVSHMSKYTASEILISRIIAEVNFEALIERNVKSQALSAILWHTLKISTSKARKLVKKAEESVWTGAVLRAVDTSLSETLWLLWNLYQADKNLCCAVLKNNKQVLRAVLLEVRHPLPIEAPALVGLMDICNIRFKPDWILIPREIAEDLASKRSVSRFALVFHCFHVLNPPVAAELKDEFEEKLFSIHGIPAEDLVEQFPIPSTREILRSILAQS